MSKITFPPLPYTEAIRKQDRDEWVYSTDQDFANPEKYGWERVYTAEQMQERDRQIAELVVRACAAVCRDDADMFARQAEGYRDGRYDWMEQGATTCAESILALLPVKEMPKSGSGHSTRADAGASTAPLPEPSLLEVFEKLRAESAKPTVELNSQDWAGMDGVIAWHLIDRHADNWADIGQMMNEWLAANGGAVGAKTPGRHGSDEQDSSAESMRLIRGEK